ncbi:hypothetical protein C8R46DRAFT_1060627 [Mycena filopes]|nr:hypothetical protein C8R46DRAFT_1060627 [Mycena filopes]
MPYQGRGGASPFLQPMRLGMPNSIPPPGFGPPAGFGGPPGFGPPPGFGGASPAFGPPLGYGPPGFTPYAFNGGAPLPGYNEPDPRYVTQWAPAWGPGDGAGWGGPGDGAGWGDGALAPYGPEDLVAQGLFPPGPMDVMDGWANGASWGNTAMMPMGSPGPSWANTPAWGNRQLAPVDGWGNSQLAPASSWANTPAWGNTALAPQFSPMQVPPDVHPVLFSKKHPYDGEYVASRPPDWRHDYVPPRRSQLISRLKRVRSGKLRINLEHCHLTPLLLMPQSKVPVMSFDLRCDHPLDPDNLELLTTSGRPFNATDLTQLATTRPVRRLRFYHPHLPWFLDVHNSQPNGVLVGDVLQQLHEKLHKPIKPHDFHNTVLNSSDREFITAAFRHRCDDRVDIMQQGVRRVDFLGAEVILQGFMEGRDGMWLMKTTRFTRHS